MTDYAEPVTAAVALERAADEIRDTADRHREEARHRTAVAEECERLSRNLRAEARRYREYQPDPEPSGEG